MGSSQSTTAAVGSCVAGTTTYANRTCSMQCGVDYKGGDYGQVSTTDYIGCLQACASDPVCTDAQFDQQDNVCFLKSTLTTPQGLSYIDSAVCTAQEDSVSLSTSASSSSTTPTPTSSCSLPVYSACTETYISSTTVYTTTVTATQYTVPTACYNSVISQSLQPSTPSTATTSAVSFVPTILACSTIVQVLSTTTISAAATVYSIGPQPFYVQASGTYSNNKYGAITTYDASVADSWMQFSASEISSATPFQLDDDCVLSTAWISANPGWFGSDFGDAYVYFGDLAARQSESYSNATCAVTADAILTCYDDQGNTTFINGGSSSYFTNDLNIYPPTATYNQVASNTLYPVTLELTFVSV